MRHIGMVGAAAVLILGASAAVADEWDARLRQIPRQLRGAPVERCAEFLASDEVEGAPTAVRRALLAEAEACFRKAMNAALDARLLRLKKKDPVRFKAEMRGQKAFNDGVKAYCGRWDAHLAGCASSGDFHEATECRVDFWSYRARQAREIQDGLLAPHTDVNGSTWAGAPLFEGWAREHCALPGPVWEAGAPPPRCLEVVLGDLSRRLRDDGKALVCEPADEAGDPWPALQAGQPPDVVAYLERAKTCAHFAGEEPYDAARAKEIREAVEEAGCAALGADEAALRERHAKAASVGAALDRAKAVLGH